MFKIEIEGADSLADVLEDAVKDGVERAVDETIAKTLQEKGLRRDQVEVIKRRGPTGDIEVEIRPRTRDQSDER
jgi:hypothetical protein